MMSSHRRSDWLKSLQENISKGRSLTRSNNNERVRTTKTTTTTTTVSSKPPEGNVDKVRNWLENTDSLPPSESPCPSLDGSVVDCLSLFEETPFSHLSALPPASSPRPIYSPPTKVLAVGKDGKPAFIPKEKDAGRVRIVKRKLAFNDLNPVTTKEVEKKGTHARKSEVCLKGSIFYHTTNRSECQLKRKVPFSPVKQNFNENLSKGQNVARKKVYVDAGAKNTASVVAESMQPTTGQSGLPSPDSTLALAPSPIPKPRKLKQDSEPEHGKTLCAAPTPLPRRKKQQAPAESPTDCAPYHGFRPTPSPRKSVEIIQGAAVSIIRPATSDQSTVSPPCRTPNPTPRSRTKEQHLVHHGGALRTPFLTPSPTPRSRTKEQHGNDISPVMAPTAPGSASYQPEHLEVKVADPTQLAVKIHTPDMSMQTSAGSGAAFVDESDILILPLFEETEHQIPAAEMDAAPETLPNNNSSSPVILSNGMAIVPPSLQETPSFILEVENAEVTLNGDNDEILAVPLPNDSFHASTPQKYNSRKRVKRLSKQDQAKQALNRGLEHLNLKGKLIPARKMGEGCSAMCRFKCHSKLSQDQRKNLFESYWALGERQRQDDFLRDCIVVTVPKVHRCGEEVKQKGHTIKYNFKFQGVGQVFVCKTMFLSTLGISESPIRTQVKKLERGIAGSPDKRGRHAKVSPELRKTNDSNIEEHIKLFKTVPSHFCRVRSKRKYLSGSLTIRQMWRLYKPWMKKNHPDDQIKSEKYYRNIFNTRFNLGFHKPKKDRCDFCLVYEIGTATQKKRMKMKYDQHLQDKLIAHQTRKEDKLYAKQNKGTSAYCLMDLQQVISLPKTEAGMVFYKRKFSVYNFTIYDGIRKKGYCYVWDESEAKRGANEIATCVLLFITQKVAEGVVEFIFWSDNCGGQNKNMYLFSMYTWAAAQFKIKIIHRYMVRGHTMNEADSMHATIGRAARYEQIFEPKGLVPIITNAKRRGKKYDIQMVGPKILDFHPLAENFQNWKKKDAKWNQVREITITHSDQCSKVFVKHDLSSKEPLEIKITKVGRQVNLATYDFPKAFNGPITLKAKKLKDLAVLCNELVIPSSSHAFYQNLINFPDLNGPLLYDTNSESEDENEDENAADFLLEYENEEIDSDTDYEEELRIARAAKSVQTNEKEKDPSDGEDGATDSEEEVESDGVVVYDEDSHSSNEEDG